MRKELITLSLVAVIIAASSGYLFLRQAAPTSTTTSQGVVPAQQTSYSSQSSSPTSSSTTAAESIGSTTTTSSSSSPPYSTTFTTLATDRTQTSTTTATASTTQKSSYYTNSTSSSSSGLKDCGSTTQFFTTPPMNLSDFVGITPLGNLNPPQHVLPTDHLYFGIRRVNQSQNGWLTQRVPVVAPGNLTIRQISSNNVSPTHTDYLVYFWPCSQFYGYFDHMTSLSPDLQALFTPPFDYCHAYVGISSGQSCTKLVQVPVHAGQYLGTAGGVQNGSNALDFGAVDYRVASLAFAAPTHYPGDRLQKVCALDYYTPSVADTLRDRLGSYDGSVHRTLPPLCGSINQDVAGTAQGNWFVKGTVFPVFEESRAIALVHDNVNASRGAFSIGSYMASLGFQPGPYYFSPKAAGLVNLDFQYAKPGQVYCYETTPRFSVGSPIITLILVQLLDPSTLRIESPSSSSTSSCGTGPWTLTSNYADFQR